MLVTPQTWDDAFEDVVAMGACAETSYGSSTFLSWNCSWLWLIYIDTQGHMWQPVCASEQPLHCSPKTDHLKFHNPTVCMYEHAPSQAWVSQHLPDLVDCPHESLKEKAILCFDTLEREEWSVLSNKKCEVLTKRGEIMMTEWQWVLKHCRSSCSMRFSASCWNKTKQDKMSFYFVCFKKQIMSTRNMVSW